MTAKKGYSQGGSELGKSHYHILSSGRQFVVVRHAHVWRPPTDVIEDEKYLYIIVEIAGMKDGDFSVTVADQRLTIAGTRPAKEQSHTGDQLAYHQLEVRYGEFLTEISLPWPVDDNAIVARYEDGFLFVQLPHAQTRKVKVVEVNK